MLIDSHCHFDFDEFDDKREDTLKACLSAGVNALIIPGVDIDQWARVCELTRRFEQQVFGGVGLHPWWIEKFIADNQGQANNQIAATLESLIIQQCEQVHCVAIGECGLDGSISCSMARQQPLFETQIEIACERSLPMIVHAHKAHNQVLRLLSQYRPEAGGVIHGFSGSYELAQQYWKLGFRLGVGGVITYERAQKTRAAIGSMPLESLLLETDAPDMPLNGLQGQPNSPVQLPAIARCLAELKNISVAEVGAATYKNTLELFKLSL
jgi:TatD DNase family protein